MFRDTGTGFNPYLDLTLADVQLQATGSSNANGAAGSQQRGQAYADQFKRFAGAQLGASLAAIIEQQKAWCADGAGMGVPGALLAEMLHHCEFAHQKCSSFVRREPLLAEAMRHIRGAPRGGEGGLDGVALCLVGVSGAGKTALLAKLASKAAFFFFLTARPPTDQSDLSGRPSV